MRGVGNKPALGVHRLVHARQQAVDGHDERAHLKGQVRFLHRVQGLLGALVDFCR